MLNWAELLQSGDPASSPAAETLLLSLLLAFVIGQIIGWVYMATHTSPSYSASFVGSLVVLPVLVSLLMILMSGSLMIAFGLLAVFAVVRFRNVLKDTRDTIYILWGIVQGMSVGTFRYSTAVIGVTCVALVLIYLWLTQFGVRHRFDAVISLLLPDDSTATREKIEQVLHRYADRATITDDRHTPEAQSLLSYRLLLRDPSRHQELREELTKAAGVQEVSFYLQEDEQEI